jgi:hypothetical protein
MRNNPPSSSSSSSSLDRWLQSFAALCDSTVTGVGTCCAADPALDPARMVAKPPPPPSPPGGAGRLPPRRAHARAPRHPAFPGTIPDDADDAASAAGSRDTTPAPAWASVEAGWADAPPSVARISTHPPQPAAARPDAGGGGGGSGGGNAADSVAGRARCLPFLPVWGGGARRRPPAPPAPPDARAARAAAAGGGGSGGGGAEQAVHRAAQRGNPEMLRFVLG